MENSKFLKPRYERKFFFRHGSLPDLERILKTHPLVFSDIFSSRYVNSLYFDTLDLQHCMDHIDGTMSRLKVRLRWYGALFGLIEKPFLELKIKQGLMGKKKLFPLSPFILDETFTRETLTKLMRDSSLPGYLKLDLSSLSGRLLCRYRRKYLSTADKAYHANLDSELEFYPVRNWHNTFIQKYSDRGSVILELKYSHENEARVERVTRHFPFRMSKHSKYLSGLEKIHSLPAALF